LAFCKKITDAGIETLAKNCPSLTTVDLTFCEMVTDFGIHALAKNCSLLKTVNLCFCKKITDKGVIALAENCKLMSTIDLTSCKITDVGIDAIVKKGLFETCFGSRRWRLGWINDENDDRR
jgi:F-box and leucine-rich repeat protein GRR1